MSDRYAKMKAAFEKQQSNRGMAAIYEGDGHYKHPATQREWENWQDAWQAATEAAKATGTAGELPPLPWGENLNREIEDWLEVRTDKEIHQFIKDYGQACAEAALAKVYAIAVEEKAKMDAEAARQPAPVVAVKPWKERQHLMDGVTDRLSDKECLSLAEAEIADLRAALAATNRSQPAPAASDIEAALRNLVEALEGAFISTWQSTAAWQDQLEAARNILDRSQP